MTITVTKDSLPEHPFWQFSVQVYQQAPAKQALLYFQQRHDLTINIILFCCWWANSGKEQLTIAELQRLLDQTALWHERVVLKLRAMRRRFRSQALPPRIQACGAWLLQEEIVAEHVEQLLLAETLLTAQATKASNANQSITNACHNLALYFNYQLIYLTASDEVYLCQLLEIIFPQFTFPQIKSLLAQFFMLSSASDVARDKT